MPVGVTSTNESWDAAWSATERAKDKKVYDQISDTYPLIKMLRSADKFDITEIVPGGKQFSFPLMYELGTGQWFDGLADLNTQATNGITTGFVSPRYLQVPIVIGAIEQSQNMAPHRVFDLLNQKTMQATQGILSTLNAALWSAQTGSAVLGLQDWIADTSTNTIAGINRTTYTWFANQTNGSGGDFDAKSDDIYTGFASMGLMETACGDGNDVPDVIGTTTTFYDQFQKIIESTGYARTKLAGPAKVGANNPAFRGAEVFKDRDCPANRMYFFNTKYMGIKIHRGYNLNKTPFQSAERQLARFARLVFGGNLICTNPRRFGVITFS